MRLRPRVARDHLRQPDPGTAEPDDRHWRSASRTSRTRPFWRDVTQSDGGIVAVDDSGAGLISLLDYLQLGGLIYRQSAPDGTCGASHRSDPDHHAIGAKINLLNEPSSRRSRSTPSIRDSSGGANNAIYISDNDRGDTDRRRNSWASHHRNPRALAFGGTWGALPTQTSCTSAMPTATSPANTGGAPPAGGGYHGDAPVDLVIRARMTGMLSSSPTALASSGQSTVARPSLTSRQPFDQGIRRSSPSPSFREREPLPTTRSSLAPTSESSPR